MRPWALAIPCVSTSPPSLSACRRAIVVAEFEAFLLYGVLACGFMRSRCAGCGHDRLVAFSCKRRGVCSSCGGRRISETGARHRVMNPMEFMARLSALAAPNPPWRVAVVPLTLVEAAGA